jgi:hypothetical protein
MQRARGPWWAALLLLVSSGIAGCDRDDGDTTTSSDDEAVEGGSAGSDGSNDSGESSESSGDDEAPLTCDELECPVGHVCVEPRAYCDESTDPPELRRDPAYCQPLVSPPEQSSAHADGELVLYLGIAMCEDPQMLEGLHGPMVTCPDEPPCT